MAGHLQYSSTTGHLIKQAGGHLSDQCTTRSCTSCSPGTAPTQLKVVLSGVTNLAGGLGCTNCGTTYNGTWFLPFFESLVEDVGPPEVTACVYQIAAGTLDCGGAVNITALIEKSSTNTQVRVHSLANWNGQFISSSMALPLDCSTINTNLTYSSGISSKCDISAATCHVESA
jgi:hypothetical protein